MEMEDIHVFGEKDYLDADELDVGATLKVKVLEYIGRRTYADRWAPYYIVQREDGKKKFFRLSITNEQLLAKQFGMKDYADLVGKTLTLTVKHFKLGHNGFIITAVDNVTTTTTPTQAQTPEPIVDTSPPATEKQIRMIHAIAKSDEAKEVIEEFLDDLGKSDVTQLTKAQASKLIDELQGNSEQATL